LRALQLANFTTPLVLEDDEQLMAVLTGVEGLDANRIVALLDSPEVTESYERDRAEARTAAASATAGWVARQSSISEGPMR